MSFSSSFAPPIPMVYGRPDCLLNAPDAVREDALDLMEVCVSLAPESRALLLKLATNLRESDRGRAQRANARSLLLFPVGVASGR